MPNKQIQSLTVEGVTYDIVDNTSGYITDYTETDPTVPAWAKADTKPSYTFSEIGSTPTSLSGYGITNAYTKTEVDGLVSGVLHYKGTKATTSALPSSNNVVGDTWHVTADGSEWAWDGTTWQELGTAVDLSGYVTTGTESSNSTTGISIADHATTTIYGVSSSTTTVTGVQSGTTAVRGVKTGTNSTTTASKVVLGDAITVPNVSASDVTIPIRADSDTTVPIAASNATIIPVKNESATVVPIMAASVTACDDITRWQAGSGDLVFTMDTTDTKKLIISHSHVVPNLEYTGHFVTGVDGTTSVYGVQSTTTSVIGVNGSTTIRGVKTGDNSTVSASKVSFGSNISIPNVTNVTDIVVPIRADSDTTVPIKDTSATTVPIKNADSTTVVTGKTHTITDTGHTHTV